ncbi:MAG: SPASM domain-containing protein [Tepidanaerobacteraceae bacterium]|jgi:radical SAM protein with 4Fe4S-binding SPASM domain|nr:SPASM domain-containing protein [Tepidanaerobacteraceae bacterium]
MITIVDRRYNYVSVFDQETGFSIRSNVYDKDGNDTEVDPFRASFPELLDIGIMGHCAHGKSGLCIKSGVECYQNGFIVEQENMSFDKFKRIIDECKGRTFQVALGGRGDPDMHENFVDMLHYARINGIVPNFTTSGFGLNKDLLPAIKQYCGVVAVSWYRSKYTIRAIDMLLSAGIKTNIHYCINCSTIDEAIEMICNKTYPKGINRIIFLLHKPVGQGRKENMLSVYDERVRHFFSLFDLPENANKAGFDSCSVPALLSFTSKIHSSTIEPCEAARFSAYISPDFKLYPCSFETRPQFGIDLEDNSIEQAWNSEEFDKFRGAFLHKCNGCRNYENCLGGCPILPEIVLCKEMK